MDPEWVGRRVVTRTGRHGGYVERAADAHAAIEARAVVGKTLLVL
jgi:hypothetical protein